MAQYPIPVRFDKETGLFLEAEAKRCRVSKNKLLQELVAKGMLAGELEAVVDKIRGVGNSISPPSKGGNRELLTAVFEARNLLKIIAARSMPEAPTLAKSQALAEVAALLGEEKPL